MRRGAISGHDPRAPRSDHPEYMQDADEPGDEGLLCLCQRDVLTLTSSNPKQTEMEAFTVWFNLQATSESSLVERGATRWMLREQVPR